MTEKKTQRFVMVLRGWVETTDGGKGQAWLRFPIGASVDGYIHEENGQLLIFKGKLGVPARPGAAWELAADIKEDGKVGGVYTSSKEEALAPKFLGHIGDPNQITMWQAASRGVEKMIEKRSREKKQAERDFFGGALDPIRDAYKKASPQARHHILADVIRYITK